MNLYLSDKSRSGNMAQSPEGGWQDDQGISYAAAGAGQWSDENGNLYFANQ